MELRLPDVISVDELTLRRPAESDRSQLMEIFNRSDDIARWTTVPFPYTDQDFDAYLGYEAERFIIERDGRVVGAIGARADWETGTAMFGYWLDREARGNGVITRSGSALCRHLFDGGIERIVAEVIVGNLASGAVLDRMGFSLEGVARSVHAPRCGLGEHRIDEQIWSLLPGELAGS
jgi:RimJ/RimL family protein N-acetyltransferase